MGVIRWSESSLRHLEEIHLWIAQDSAIQASRIVEQIWERTQIFQDNPRIGHLWTADGIGEIRLLFYGHHKVAYRFIHSSKDVEILGVFHGRMELETRMRRLKRE